MCSGKCMIDQWITRYNCRHIKNILDIDDTARLRLTIGTSPTSDLVTRFPSLPLRVCRRSARGAANVFIAMHSQLLDMARLFRHGWYRVFIQLIVTSVCLLVHRLVGLLVTVTVSWLASYTPSSCYFWQLVGIYTVIQKTSSTLFVDNFAKCWPIFRTPSLLDTYVQADRRHKQQRLESSCVFTVRCSNASAVLGVVILPVFRPSVTRMLYDKAKGHTADILIPHERAVIGPQL